MRKPNLKVLISAYACEPNKGSEPKVGWSSVRLISSIVAEAHVITRANNKKVIEKAGFPSNVYFHYVDLPFPFIWAKKKFPLFIYVYNHLWQLFAAFTALKLDRNINFDVVHHVTFVTIATPSYLWFLRKPFIWGPVGGGERTPKMLNKVMILGVKGKIWETFRALRINLSLLNPLIRLTVWNADKIFVTTKETRSMLGRSARKKIDILPAVTFEPSSKINKAYPKKSKTIIYVGKTLSYKGIRIFLQVAKELLELDSSFQFKIIGASKNDQYIRKYISDHQLSSKIEIIPWIPYEKIVGFYKQALCLLSTSLHDSGGYVLLEAISYSCPVFSLDTGGPKTMISNKGVSKTISIKQPLEKIVKEYIKNIMEIRPIPKLNPKIELNSIFFEEKKRDKIYDAYKKAMNLKNKVQNLGGFQLRKGNTHVILPTKLHPKWIISLESKKIFSQSFNLYNPSTIKGRVLKLFFIKMYWVIKRVGKGRVSFIKAPNYLNSKMAFSVSFGTPGPTQKLTFISFKNEVVDSYIKLAKTEVSRKNLRNEKEVLLRLCNVTKSFDVPSVKSFNDQKGMTWLELSTNSDLKPISAKWTPKIEQLQSEIAGLDRSQPFSHGDFAPWNIKKSPSGKFFVFDWEFSAKASPLYDRVYFAYQIELLLKKRPLQKLTSAFLAKKYFPTNLSKLDRYQIERSIERIRILSQRG